MRHALALWVFVTCCILPGSSQDQGALASSAELGKAPPLSVQGKKDLRFGDLLPGVNLTLTYTDANAGYWHVRGDKNQEIQLTFVSLPTELDGGGDQMPVSFNSNAAGYSYKKRPADALPFDPSVGLTVRFDQTGQLHIWIGGTARPKGTQSPGSYVAPITLEAIYTGN